MRFEAILAVTCLAMALCCQRPQERVRSTRTSAELADLCDPSGPLVFRRAATTPRDGWLPVLHQNQQWYLEPGASLCPRHITRVTIDRNELLLYDATIVVTDEGRRIVAQMTRVLGEHFAISVFGHIHSIPRVEGPIDSDSGKITFGEDQLLVWQRVAESIGRR